MSLSCFFSIDNSEKKKCYDVHFTYQYWYVNMSIRKKNSTIKVLFSTSCWLSVEYKTFTCLPKWLQRDQGLGLWRRRKFQQKMSGYDLCSAVVWSNPKSLLDKFHSSWHRLGYQMVKHLFTQVQNISLSSWMSAIYTTDRSQSWPMKKTNS